MRALTHIPLDRAIVRRRWPANVRTPRDVSNARAAARRRGPPAERATVGRSTSREREGRTNQKTQDEPQRIVAQRLLSTLTILGFKLVVYKRSINTTTILSNTRVLV
jgi:hypothetical protein